MLEGLRTCYIISYPLHKYCSIEWLSAQPRGKEQCVPVWRWFKLRTSVTSCFVPPGFEQVWSGWVISNLWRTYTSVNPSVHLPALAFSPSPHCSANETSCSLSRWRQIICICPWLTSVHAPHCDILRSNKILTLIQVVSDDAMCD